MKITRKHRKSILEVLLDFDKKNSDAKHTSGGFYKFQ